MYKSDKIFLIIFAITLMTVIGYLVKEKYDEPLSLQDLKIGECYEGMLHYYPFKVDRIEIKSGYEEPVISFKRSFYSEIVQLKKDNFKKVDCIQAEITNLKEGMASLVNELERLKIKLE